MTDHERATRLIRDLRDALRLTKCDAERHGERYGNQANCVKALKAADRWFQDAPQPLRTPPAPRGGGDVPQPLPGASGAAGRT